LLSERVIDSATADPALVKDHLALVKERSVALRRRVSSRPTSMDPPPRVSDWSSSGAATHSDFTLVPLSQRHAAAALLVVAAVITKYRPSLQIILR